MTNQPANSIVINASGSPLSGSTASASYIAPLRNLPITNAVYYNSTTFELSYTVSNYASKFDIQDLSTNTNIIYSLQPKTYFFNTDPSAGQQIGYMAEDVATLNYNFATYNEPSGNPIAVNYDTILVFLVEQIKSLKNTITTLQGLNSSIIGGYARDIKRANTTFFGLYWPSYTDAASTIENEVVSYIPLNCSISNLYINLSANAGSAGTSYTFTVRKNGVDTDLVITITGATSSGSNLINSLNFSSGDTFSISADPSSPRPDDNLEVRWTARLTPI
jgi:hypothetical protein